MTSSGRHLKRPAVTDFQDVGPSLGGSGGMRRAQEGAVRVSELLLAHQRAFLQLGFEVPEIMQIANDQFESRECPRTVNSRKVCSRARQVTSTK